jgi:general secretion pathway protein H
VADAARARGVTLLELLLVISIMALAVAGVSLALRDGAQSQLEREAGRLSALLEAGRAQSRATGVPVRWLPTKDGFRFEGMSPGALPEQWLAPDVAVRWTEGLVLGPEPIIGPQAVVLTSLKNPDRQLSVRTDGLRPFRVAPLEGAGPATP